MFKPYHERVNKLIHQKSTWKTFIHSCGSVRELLPEFIEAGFTSSTRAVLGRRMDAREIKREFGRHLTFWGGGANTQQTLSFGTRRRSTARCASGWKSSARTAASSSTPSTTSRHHATANMVAMFRALKDSG